MGGKVLVGLLLIRDNCSVRDKSAISESAYFRIVFVNVFCTGGI